MKKRNSSLYLTLTIAFVTLVSLIAGIIVNVVTHSFSINILLGIGVVLALVSLIGGIFAIVEIAQEKRANKPDNDKATTVTKDIKIRFILREEPVTIEAPDAKSAAEVFQEIHENVMKHENLLKAESLGTMEETKPEAPDVPETKENEE